MAGIYGINFEHMPELNWLLGYPFALVLIVSSAVLTVWFSSGAAGLAVRG